MSTADTSMLRQLCALELRVARWQAQLAEDDEALHQLRIDLRRLRALLRPLRGLDELAGAARDLGRLSAPLRDRQVLAAELLRRAPGLAEPWQAEQRDACRWLREAPQLARLRQCLAQAPAQWLALDGRLRPRALRDDLDRQWRELGRAARQPGADWHGLRVAIKRLRYGCELYPEARPRELGRLGRLRALQALIGDWHDRQRWLQLSEDRPALQALRETWRNEGEALGERVEAELRRLARAHAWR